MIGNNHLGSTTRVVDHYQINGVNGHHNGVRSGSTFARRPTSFSSRIRAVRESANEESHKEESSKEEINDDEILQ